MLSWIDTLRKARTIQQSRLFSDEAYRRQNPDIGRYPPLLHFLRHGAEFGRHHGQNSLTEWLLPGLMSGQLTSKLARALSINPTLNVPGNIKNNDQGRTAPNPVDLQFLEAWSAMDFANARAILPDTSPLMSVMGAHRFADTHNDMSFADFALEKIADQLSSLTAQQLRLVLNLSQAKSSNRMPKIEGQSLHQRIGDALLAALSLSKDPLHAQVMGAGLTLFDGSAKLMGLPQSMQVIDHSDHSKPWISQLNKLPEIIRHLLSVASLNSLRMDPLGLKRLNDNEWQIVKSPSDAVKLRLLRPHYWTSPQDSNPITSQAIFLQRRFAEACVRDGITIVPVMASPLFDITNEDHWGLPTFSYHTLDRDHGAHPPAIHYKESYLPGFIFHNPAGYGGWSDTDKIMTHEPISHSHKFDLFFQHLVATYAKSGRSKYDQPLSDGDIPNRPFIFAPLQVPDDTVSRLARIQVEDWLQVALDVSRSRNVPLVIKAHPKDKSEMTLRRLTTFRESGAIIVDAPIHALLAACTCVITTNSGVGFEALLHAKPVITCGASDYESATLAAKTCDDVRSYLNTALNGSTVPVSALREFLHIYCNKHCWYLEDVPIHGSVNIMSGLANETASLISDS